MKLILQPGNRVLEVSQGENLQDYLFTAGVEFPCGGQGSCRNCRIQVLEGEAPPTPEDAEQFSPREIQAGWRLACRLAPRGDLVLFVREWESSILTDEAPVKFQPRDGLGIAVDLGTTTVVAQLVDLSSGGIRSARASLNRQRRHGEDVMARLASAADAGRRRSLFLSIREQLGEMIEALVRDAAVPGPPVREIVVVGNAAMRGFLFDEDPRHLAFSPYEPPEVGSREVEARDLGWEAAGEARVFFPPLLGGIVGSDVLAGMIATDLRRVEGPAALADLGTNAEVVIWSAGKLVVASAAAGPAFEGGRIEKGMIARRGAIDSVSLQEGEVRVHVIGNAAPEGICGSGLVDAVACGLDLKKIAESGRMEGPKRWELAPPVFISQADVRELQLAKGAVRACLDLLLQALRLSPERLEKLYLAGGFGNYVSPRSAARIGLFPVSPQRIQAAGNTALRGCRQVLLAGREGRAACEEIRSRTTHLRLAEDASFQETFVGAMSFGP